MTHILCRHILWQTRISTNLLRNTKTTTTITSRDVVYKLVIVHLMQHPIFLATIKLIAQQEAEMLFKIF